MSALRLFENGDSVPAFVCQTTVNPQFRFHTLAGRYVVLSFLGAGKIQSSLHLVQAVQGKLASLFHTDRIVFAGVSIDPQDEKQNIFRTQDPFVYFWDYEQAISRLYGAIHPQTPEGQQVAYHPFTMVLDPNLRVIDSFPTDENAVQRLETLLTTLPPVEEYMGVPPHAPVLIVPRIFSPDFCQELMDFYDREGGKESGTMTEKEGLTVLRIDPTFKRRSDVIIEEESLKGRIRQYMIRHLLPEIKKSFQFEATHIERYLVACYDSMSGGFFKPHRDNTTRGTMHRKFACSINLNPQGYDGGDLRFPEFGQRTYRAPQGGAVIFSCSLLHEATAVTRGRRYAFLPFLYDEEGARIRDENLKYVNL